MMSPCSEPMDIRINRRITEHWLWRNAEHVGWWLDLLFMAATEAHQVSIDTHTFVLERGQVLASVAYLSTRWNRDRKTVMRFLKALQDDNMIQRCVKDRHAAILTIRNFDQFSCPTEMGGDTIKDVLKDTLIQRQGDTLNSGGRDTIKDTLNPDEQRVSAASVDIIKDTLNNGEGDTLISTQGDTIRDTIKDTNIYNRKKIISSLRSDIMKEKISFKKSIDLDKFIVFFNSEMEQAGAIIPKIRTITGQRQNHVYARCREFGRQSLAEVVKKAAASDYLNGKNQRGWVADFSWLFRPNNFVKVLEGNFDNRNEDNKQINQIQRRGFEVGAVNAEEYKTTF